MFSCCQYCEVSPLRHVCLPGNWCSVLEIRGLLRSLGQIFNIFVMLPLFGHTDWENAKLLCVCNKNGTRLWSIWIQGRTNQNQKSIQLWQEEIWDSVHRAGGGTWHCILFLHCFPLLSAVLVACYSSALSFSLQRRLQTFLVGAPRSLTTRQLSQRQFCSLSLCLWILMENLVQSWGYWGGEAYMKQKEG